MLKYRTQLRTQTRLSKIAVQSSKERRSSTDSHSNINNNIKSLNQIETYRSKLSPKNNTSIRLYFKNVNSLSTNIKN